LLHQPLEHDLPRNLTGLQDTLIRQRVMDLGSTTLSTYQASLSHDGEVLADLGLPLPCDLDQGFHRSWSLPKQVKEFQTGWVRQDMTEVSLQLIELQFSFSFHHFLLHFIRIFDLVNILTDVREYVKPHRNVIPL